MACYSVIPRCYSCDPPYSAIPFRRQIKLCNRAGLLQNGKRAERQKWEKNGKVVENLPRSKMGKKWPKNTEKNGKSARFSIFSVFFGHFFPIFDRGKFSTIFPFFSHFCRSARFPFCSRPARLQSLICDNPPLCLCCMQA